jgi:hypothetical protein
VTFRRLETVALLTAGVALGGVTVAESARLAPVTERQRADVRLVAGWVRSTQHRAPTATDAHLGAGTDTACAVVGVGGLVRVCVAVARPARGAPRVVGGWHVPALAPNRPRRRYGCWGEAVDRCGRGALPGA